MKKIERENFEVIFMESLELFRQSGNGRVGVAPE